VNTIPVSDSDVTNPVVQARLSKQSMTILELLKMGPANTSELVDIAPQYSARIADLRKVGYHIECWAESEEDGLHWYRLSAPEPILKEFVVPTVVRVYGREPEVIDFPVMAASWEQAKRAARFNAATARAEEDAHDRQ
jgi:hypothetical protein